MRRFTNILLCTIALALISCIDGGKVENGENSPSADKGVLTLNIDSRTTGNAMPDFTLCIYQKGDTKEMLVRKYTSDSDIPEFIWILAGEYYATIESGVAKAASMDNNYYFGRTDFTISAGNTTNVDLVATLQNIPVEVVFDESITKNCLEGYAVDIFAAADLNAVNSDTPQLKYTENSTGYFIMPEGVTTLVWNFKGTYKYADNGEEVLLDKSGTIANVEPKKHYRLSFKFSPDASGMLGGLSVTLDTSIDERDDHLSFNPDPELKGVGFDLSISCDYTGGERKYVATSPSDFTSVKISVDDMEIDPVANVVDGIALEGLNTPKLFITLSDNFFNSLSGGSKLITLDVSDKDGGEVIRELSYNLQGINGYNNSNEVLAWAGGTTQLSATVFGSPSLVQIVYREGEGEWKSFNATESGTNTYTAQIEGIEANRTYEYNLLIDGKTIGTSGKFTTRSGNQIPNGDLEDWCENGDGVIIPWSSASNPYWCSGNYGTAILSKNITKSSSDVRPGSTGKRSVYMDSEYIVIKFAAGNVYIGSWGGMDGTNAKVNFGQPFTFNAKPKAIRFWAKFNCGKINKVKTGKGKEGNPDLAKIFCCLCDWSQPHLVDSSKGEATTFSPSDADIKSGDARYNGVLYSAYMDTTTSQTEWKEFEIPFTFYGDDPTKVPNYLVLTFTCSGYGDFFDGSTDSWMYVDDIEFVY